MIDHAGMGRQSDGTPQANTGTTHFPDELVDNILWEIAAAGGQVRKGYRQWLDALLGHHGIEDGDITKLPFAIPSERTARDWKSKTKRDRYETILKIKTDQLDERVMGAASTLAIAMEEVERDALKQTAAGLAHANGIEASTILRNVSQAKKIQMDAVTSARATRAFERELPNILELGRGLAALGVAQLVSATGEEIVDADADEVG